MANGTKSGSYSSCADLRILGPAVWTYWRLLVSNPTDHAVPKCFAAHGKTVPVRCLGLSLLQPEARVQIAHQRHVRSIAASYRQGLSGQLHSTCMAKGVASSEGLESGGVAIGETSCGCHDAHHGLRWGGSELICG
eukprot:1570580-Amphidinium_carterae.1